MPHLNLDDIPLQKDASRNKKILYKEFKRGYLFFIAKEWELVRF